MTSIEASVLVAATPQEFFDATLAIEQMPGWVDWQPVFVGSGMRMLDVTEGAGTTFEFALQGTGAPARAELIEYGPERYAARLAGGIFAEALATWTVTPRGASCTATYTFTYRTRFAPFGYLIDALMLRPRLRRLFAEQMEACKQRAEHYASEAAHPSAASSEAR